jgi:hypothetical protein
MPNANKSEGCASAPSWPLAELDTKIEATCAEPSGDLRKRAGLTSSRWSDDQSKAMVQFRRVSQADQDLLRQWTVRHRLHPTLRTDLAIDDTVSFMVQQSSYAFIEW